MDARLKTICGLLDSPDPLRRTAAAVVLGALAPPDPAVSRALGEALPGANQTLTAAILDAFEAIGGREALPYLFPLLDAEDVAVQMRAIGAIAKAGSAALPHIRPLLDHAGPSKTLMLVDLLARLPTADAMRTLLSLLPGADADLTTEIAEAVRRHARSLPPASRGALHKLVVQFMGGAAVRQSERLQGAGLRLLGALARPEARTALLRCAEPKSPPRIRLQALRGLQDLEWTAATARPVVARLRTYLADADPDVAQQALRVIGSLPPAALTASQWHTLLDGPNESIRSLALTRLTEDQSAAGQRVLLELLRHPSGQVQEAAATALAQRASAAGDVLGALLAETDRDRAWRLARILKPQATTLAPRDRKRLAERTAAAVKAGKPAAEALLFLLRNADGAAAEALHRDAAYAAMHAKHWAEAVDGFRRLMQSPGFDEDCRYALSLCNLKVSPKALAPALRAEDHALRGFQALLRHPANKLLARLAKEKSLDADELYYVGFHFSDLTGPEREFGEGLLRHVQKRWPRSPAGKAAKSKLGVSGSAAPAKPARRR